MEKTESLVGKWRQIKQTIAELEKEIENLGLKIDGLRNRGLKEHLAETIDLLLQFKSQYEKAEQQLSNSRSLLAETTEEIVSRIRYANVTSIFIPSAQPNVAGTQVSIDENGDLKTVARFS
ncbi:MAG TPA: hypothetical protein VD996_02515 [Chitinophagaceae bacterium]|nr:hypothetical protein [Chitinophagaceae bacterium]